MATAGTPAITEISQNLDAAEIISDFKQRYPKSQNIKTDLESFLTALEERLDSERTEAEEHVRVIAEELEIVEESGSVVGRLSAIAGILEDKTSIREVGAEEMANICRDLVDREILPCPDLYLRKKIEALAEALKSFDPKNQQVDFYEVAKTKIVCS